MTVHTTSGDLVMIAVTADSDALDAAIDTAVETGRRLWLVSSREWPDTLLLSAMRTVTALCEGHGRVCSWELSTIRMEATASISVPVLTDPARPGCGDASHPSAGVGGTVSLGDGASDARLVSAGESSVAVGSGTPPGAGPDTIVFTCGAPVTWAGTRWATVIRECDDCESAAACVVVDFADGTGPMHVDAADLEFRDMRVDVGAIDRLTVLLVAYVGFVLGFGALVARAVAS